MSTEYYYVGIDDGEHHDMYFTSSSLFETLCEFNEAKVDKDTQEFEWVEWGVYDLEESYIEAVDSYFFGGEE